MSDKNMKNGIPKVIELNPKCLVPNLEEILRLAKDGKIECFILAAFTPEGELVTSKAELDIYSQQVLVSFLQTQTTIRTMTESCMVDFDDDDEDYDDDPED